MSKTRDKSTPNTKVAVDQMRELIFSGKLGAGTDHLESELAVTLGMSRTPVREALLMLQGQGLVEVRPRKGVRILPLSAVDMREIYDVLTEIESLAASDAAQIGYAPRHLSKLSKSIDQMDRALEAEDREAWARADDSFHEELVRLGGNSRSISIAAMMSDQVRRARAVTLYMRPVPTQSNDDHRGVLKAISEKNPEEARKIHREHRRMAKDILISLLEKYQLKAV